MISNFLVFVFEDETSTQIKSKDQKKTKLLKSRLNLQISFICVCQYLHSIFIMIEIFSFPTRNSDKNALSLSRQTSGTPESFFRTTTTSLLTNLLLSRYFYHTKNIIILTIQRNVCCSALSKRKLFEFFFSLSLEFPTNTSEMKVNKKASWLRFSKQRQ